MAEFHFPTPNRFTAALFEQLRRHPKRVVFPEAEDIRILRVAGEMIRLEIGTPILLGEKDKIHALAKAEGIDMTFAHVINPAEADDLPLFCARFTRMERYRRMQGAKPEDFMTKPHYFAAMMVQYGQVDAVVAGNQSYPATVFRAVLHLIKPTPDVPNVFGAVIMVDDRNPDKKERTLFLADCGLQPEPSPESLAAMAVTTGALCRHVEGVVPRVAMLSYSNKGSSPGPGPLKVEAATALARDLARRNNIEMHIDGELQADAALIPEIAARKTQGVMLKGAADVLIFPNLDAAHIAFKLLHHIAGLKSYGQLMLGLSRPVAQISRSATEEQILGTTAAVAVEAVKLHDLHPDGILGESW